MSVEVVPKQYMSATEADAAEKRGEIARALAEHGMEDVYVIDRESAREILTEKRTELLDALKEGRRSPCATSPTQSAATSPW